MGNRLHKQLMKQKEFSHEKKMMQIVEFLIFIGGIFFNYFLKTQNQWHEWYARKKFCVFIQFLNLKNPTQFIPVHALWAQRGKIDWVNFKECLNNFALNVIRIWNILNHLLMQNLLIHQSYFNYFKDKTSIIRIMQHIRKNILWLFGSLFEYWYLTT